MATCEANHADVLASDMIAVDETWWRLMKKGSSKLCGGEPRAYLREATLRAVRNPGTVTLARDLKSPEA
jgi:hypothetical protein